MRHQGPDQVLLKAAELGQDIDLMFMTAAPLVALDDVCMAEQDWDAAERAYRAALEDAFRGTTRAMMASAGRKYAALCQARRDHVRAVRLLAACGSISSGWDSFIYFDPIASGEHILTAAQTAWARRNSHARLARVSRSRSRRQLWTHCDPKRSAEAVTRVDGGGADRQRSTERSS